MSEPKRATIKIYRRTAYLMFCNYKRSPKILDARELIARCYEIS